MATTSEARALPFFTDLQGQPLSSGYIYIGQAGLDPIAYPAVINSDLAGTTVLSQPVRTTNGYATSAGALVHLFVEVPYSIMILDSAKQIVYVSLNETDPVALAVASSSVQSAPDLPTLRARSGSSTNQVWVNNFGMYAYVPSDKTSPESIPFVIVGNDGSRYYLSLQYVNSGWVRANAPANQNSPGAWLSWDTSTSTTLLTNNEGSGSGGIILRVVNASNTVEMARATLASTGEFDVAGAITSVGTITGNNLTSSQNVTALGGNFIMTADGGRYITYSAGAGKYLLPGSDLLVNNSLVMNQINLASNQLTFGVGAIIMTNGSAPIQPGTWTVQVTGLGTSGLAQYVRTA